MSVSVTQHLSRFPLAFLPTPIHPLPRLSALLDGPKLWIKRDDQTGLATGGNKSRKLEFLIGDALAQNADTVLTTGAVQSNHCRQTAASALPAGLKCHLVLSGEKPDEINGNLLLDQLLGATVHWTTRESRFSRLAELADELRAEGKRPYIIPLGGSNAVGAVGCVLAAEELWAQVHAPDIKYDAIVIASGSGGTQAGLVAGTWALGWDVPILGINVSAHAAELQAKVAELATATAARLNRPHTFQPDEIRVNDDYLGEGYGIIGDLERDAIKTVARAEGVLLDPVYTGRAFGGLLDLISAGTFTKDQNVLFWHTGGAPALFAYAGELVAPDVHTDEAARD